jgi:chromosome segregation ATPase
MEAQVRRSIDEVVSTLGHLEDKIGDQKAEIVDLRTKVVALEVHGSDLKESVDAHGDEIEKACSLVEAQMSNLMKSIDARGEDMEGKVTKLSELIESKVNSLSVDINKKLRAFELRRCVHLWLSIHPCALEF